MNTDLTTTENAGAITTPVDFERSVMQEGATPFLTGLRIKNKNSLIEGCIDGHWVLGKEDIGSSVKAIVGPWRYSARRFKKDSLDLQSFNMCSENTYDPIKNEWIIRKPTKSFMDIYNKVVPDNGLACTNLTGSDFLLYLPELDRFVFYFISGSTKRYTNTHPMLKQCYQQSIVLRTIPNPSKTYPGNFWPHILLSTEPAIFPPKWAEECQKFIAAEEEVDEATNPSRPR